VRRRDAIFLKPLLAPLAETASGEAPVFFFFDHDDKAVESIALSFTRWIDEFRAIAPH
jgi:hypothetical protein